MLNLGIIGKGYWGSKLIDTFSKIKSVTIKTVATTDNEEIFLDNTIDAIVIVAPIKNLYLLAIKGLISKKHVFLEKPIAHNYISAKLIQNTYRDFNEKILFLGYINAYGKIYQKIKEILNDDPPVFICCGWKKHGTFNNDILLNLASHDIYLCLDLFNEYPKNISLKKYSKNKIQFNLNFAFKNTAYISVDRDSNEKVKRVGIITQRGRSLYWINNKLYDSELNKENFGLLLEDSSDILTTECQLFIDSIIENKNKGACLKKAVDVLKIIDNLKSKLDISELYLVGLKNTQ